MAKLSYTFLLAVLVSILFVADSSAKVAATPPVSHELYCQAFPGEVNPLCSRQDAIIGAYTPTAKKVGKQGVVVYRLQVRLRSQSRAVMTLELVLQARCQQMAHEETTIKRKILLKKGMNVVAVPVGSKFVARCHPKYGPVTGYNLTALGYIKGIVYVYGEAEALIR